MAMKEKIGLIGLGNIGSFYAEQLTKAQYPLFVMDIDQDRVRKAEAFGAVSEKSPAGIAEKAQIIILALPGSKAVEQVMDGEEGLLVNSRKGQLIIDTGTSRPETDIRYEKLCAEKGVGFIDSPLTWRRQGQILMVGGKAEYYDRAKELLECISYKCMHVGKIGEGQVLKMMNQALLANHLAVNAEIVEMAKKHQMDPRLLKDYLEFDIPELLYGDDFSGGGHLTLHYKDLGYLLEIAHESGAHIPVSSLVHEIFKASKLYGDEMHADERWLQGGIASYWRRMNDPKYEK